MRASIRVIALWAALGASPVASAADDAAAGLRAALAAGETITYTLTNLDTRKSSTLTVKRLREDEYVRSDGARLKDLLHVANDSRFVYSPPLPSLKGAERTWKHSGTVSERTGVRTSIVESSFRLLGRSTLETPAGTFEVTEVEEKRAISGSLFLVRRFIDEARGLVIREVTRSIRVEPQMSGGLEVIMGRTNTDLLLERLPRS